MDKWKGERKKEKKKRSMI